MVWRGRADGSFLYTKPLDKTHSDIPCGFMPFNDHNLKNILFDIGMGHSIFQKDFPHNFFCDNLIWYELDDFGKGLVTCEEESILFKGFDSNRVLGLGTLPFLVRTQKHLTIFCNQYTIFKNLIDLKSPQMIKADNICPITGSNCPQVIEPEIFCSI